MCHLHDETDSSNGRRGFIKKLSTAGLITGGLLSSQLSSGIPKLASAFSDNEMPEEKWLRSEVLRSGKAEHFTILHTADIHAQLFTHDEFFWENGKAVYRKRGGMAVLKTMLHQLRKQNPGKTLLLDGGDCFQGSAVAALTQGRAIVPLINNIGYDLMLPGNWEVVYGKEMLMKDMGGYSAEKVCANMFHDEESRKGEMIYPPYWIKHFG
ncbi:MAG: metallophosphoesterase, partial [Chitinophagaceae bacterium]